MDGIRVRGLARELGLTNEEVIGELRKLSVPADKAADILTDEQADMVRDLKAPPKEPTASMLAKRAAAQRAKEKAEEEKNLFDELLDRYLSEGEMEGLELSFRSERHVYDEEGEDVPAGEEKTVTARGAREIEEAFSVFTAGYYKRDEYWQPTAATVTMNGRAVECRLDLYDPGDLTYILVRDIWENGGDIDEDGARVENALRIWRACDDRRR